MDLSLQCLHLIRIYVASDKIALLQEMFNSHEQSEIACQNLVCRLVTYLVFMMKLVISSFCPYLSPAILQLYDPAVSFLICSRTWVQGLGF